MPFQRLAASLTLSRSNTRQLLSATGSASSLPTSGNVFNLDTQAFVAIEIVISCVLCLFGLLLLLAGVRLYRLSLFITSWVGSSGLVYFVCIVSGLDPADSLFVALVTTFVLSALIVWKVYRLAIFFTGLEVGFIGWTGFHSLFPTAINDETGLYVLLAIPSLLIAVFAAKFAKPAMLVMTPIVGSFFIIQGLNVFIQQRWNVFKVLNNQVNVCLGYACYVAYAVALVVSVLGLTFQYCFTARMDVESLDNHEMIPHKRKNLIPNTLSTDPHLTTLSSRPHEYRPQLDKPEQRVVDPANAKPANSQRRGLSTQARRMLRRMRQYRNYTAKHGESMVISQQHTFKPMNGGPVDAVRSVTHSPHSLNSLPTPNSEQHSRSSSTAPAAVLDTRKPIKLPETHLIVIPPQTSYKPPMPVKPVLKNNVT